MLDADLAEIYGYSTIMQLEDIAGYRALFEKLLEEGE